MAPKETKGRSFIKFPRAKQPEHNGEYFIQDENIRFNRKEGSVPNLPESHSRSTIVKALMGEDASSGNALELARAHNALVLKNMGGRVCGPSGGKVINLGLPRTGTKVITEVLKQVGYNACHQIRDWKMSDVKSYAHDPMNSASESIRAGLSTCDALSDIPVYGIWRSLMSTEQNARFVLTTRDMHPWLVAIEALFEFWEPKLRKDYGAFHSWYFNSAVYNKDAFSATFRSHHEDILKALGDRVLVLPFSMPDDEKLSKLMEFTGCESMQSQVVYPTKPESYAW
eukprot:CAMPEP_0114227324 /NCGR_PEP_ID=MMETSP0058-20121206/1729_1 /TAXON_ID=36894 /ORGANISM="Pyramimonas parkeae, CCMP726" /LENGTH=283 /DNA_ID=CAMNT_0001338157 /DNA_START=135 /DNA_END=984 /DNA_ORIENTATION=-